MKKTYTSHSILHFSLGGTRVAFTPLSTKSSYFETCDETLQKRIEAHPWFGDKFVIGAEEAVVEEKNAEEADNSEKRKAELKEVSFTTLADAKEWLANEYGVARSNIKKKDDAVKAGKANGVIIVIGVSGTPAKSEPDEDGGKTED